jgi:hypothetical protein
MKVTQLPGRPDRRAVDFELDEFTPSRYARVIYHQQENQRTHRVIHAQAFEVDKGGRFVAAADGSPSRTAGTPHTIVVQGAPPTQGRLDTITQTKAEELVKLLQSASQLDELDL